MKKSKKMKRKVGIGAMIVGLVCCIGVVLIHHVVIRTSSEISSSDFTTNMIARNAKARVNKFLSGDIDSFVNDICDERYAFAGHMKNYDILISDIKDELQQIYEDEIKDNKYEVRVESANTSYMVDNGQENMCTDVSIYVSQGKKTVLVVNYTYLNYKSGRITFLHRGLDEESTKDIPKCYERIEQLAGLLQSSMREEYGLGTTVVESYIEDLDDDYEEREGLFEHIIVDSNDDCKEMYKRLVKIFKKGIKIDSCSTTGTWYDSEEKVIKAKLVLVLSDKKGDKVTLIQDVRLFDIKENKKGGVNGCTYTCADKDAEIIGEGLEGASIKTLQKLFR